MRLTFFNQQLGTSTRLNVPESGQLSQDQVRRARRALAPLAPDRFGLLGESGPGQAPELQGGVTVKLYPLSDGGVLVRAEAAA